MNLIGKRKLWYLISLLIIVPGTVSLIFNGLRLGIEFKGGQNLEVAGQISSDEIKDTTQRLKLKDVNIVSSGDNSLIRYRDEANPKGQQANHQVLSKELAAKGHPEVSFATVGPSVSATLPVTPLLAWRLPHWR